VAVQEYEKNLASLRRERDDLKKQNQQQTETITDLNRTLQAERQELLTYRTRHDKAVGAASSSLQAIVLTFHREIPH